MRTMRTFVIAGIAVAALGALTAIAAGQNEIDNNFKYNSGQDVQPVFEGWSRNPDGTFDMHFGYLNRNWVEEPAVSIGPGNSIEPGGPDRGQPAYFYTRTNRNLFAVTVPKDFGKKEVTWTLTVNGKTDKAVGWLQPEWEIDKAGGASLGGRQDAEFKNNKAPVLNVEAPAPSITLPATLTLTSNVTDDGLPKPATGPRKAPVGQETPPLLQGGVNDAPVNVPQVAGPGRGAGGPGGGGTPPALTVTWMVWRGPAAADFQPRTAPVKDGKAQTTVKFSKPGEYVLRAGASDRLLTSYKEVRVTVRGGQTSNQH
jgi:hypothetical protein